MKKYDVVALGELLIDFTQNGFSAQGNPVFEANPGGAPGNVLAMLQKLGRKTAFIGKVGRDGFGYQLEAALKEVGIDTEQLCFDEEVHTTLAVVQKKADGDRDFSFYRKPGADIMLRAEELQEEVIKETKMFHFGSLSLTDEPVREATRKAVAAAEAAGAVISFDPNLRKPLWKTEELARQQIRYGFQHCQVLKLSDDELVWFTGENDFDKAMKCLREEFSIPLVLFSMGKQGSRAYCGDVMVEVPAFLREDTIETTGAGDTFMGCMLHQILEKGYENLNREELKEMLTFANAAASIITTRRGALRVMPEETEIRNSLVPDNQ
ncbi:MAG: carbohydrate kinase [Lachnospiraceae bacterium]|nr:carbohydrate kinase [Lachnospiraceae bacterium]